mgnify:FL=1
MLNWGTAVEPAYGGTRATKQPDEVIHRTRNSRPGAARVNLPALPLAHAIDVLTFATTLPTK